MRENYVTWHAGRGQGPVRIGADLRRHGIPAALIESALAAGSGLGGAGAQAVSRQVRPGDAGELAREGAADALFAVSWLFIGSYPRGHWRRSRLD